MAIRKSTSSNTKGDYYRCGERLARGKDESPEKEAKMKKYN